MKQLLVVASLLLFSSSGSAEPGTVGTSANKPAVKVKVDHTVTSDRASNEIKIEEKVENKDLMGKFLSKKIISALRVLPGVKNIQFVKGNVKSEKSWSDYYNHDRESHMVIQFTFSNPVSMMFKVTERFRTCSEVKADDWDDDDDESYTQASSDCQLETSMTINGPIAVYGNFAGALNQELLFKDQLTVNFTYGMDYSRSDTKVSSYVYANRMDFSRAIQKVLDWSKMDVSLNDPVRVTLVQAGRVLKDINKELLKGK